MRKIIICLTLVISLCSFGYADSVCRKDTVSRFMRLPIGRTFTTFTAYNDFSWAGGQLNSNITRHEKDQSGYLTRYADGQALPVNIVIVGGDLVEGNRTQGAISNSNTEGYTLFNGRMTCTGVWSYAASNATVTLTGLDPRLDYEIVVFGNRDNIGAISRLTTITISDVSSFRNTSTPGATFTGEADPAVTIANGYNTVTGYVAWFADVKSGDDGDILITISSPTNQYYTNAFMLKANARE